MPTPMSPTPPEFAREDYKTVVLAITMPRAWIGLTPQAIRVKLTKDSRLLDFLTQEVHRWLNAPDLDAAEVANNLQRLVMQPRGGGGGT